MNQLVVTTGKRFCDIDGLACVIAYTMMPEKPLALIAGPFNETVTQTVKKWPLNYQTRLEPGDYQFIVMDVSEPSEFPFPVVKEKVVEIYDHHFGFEKYWQQRLGEKAKIEAVGACATLIWEEFKKKNSPPHLTLDPQPTSHPHPQISSLAANLLYTAIISNTLDFHASATTERDKKAFEELKSHIDLPDNWIGQYYQEQEVSIYINPTLAISNDTKIQTIKGVKCAIGQIELWNSKNFLKDHAQEIEAVLRECKTEQWLFISPSIQEGRSYLFTKSETMKNLLRSVMSVDFFGTDTGVTPKLWLRKEILKKIQ